MFNISLFIHLVGIIIALGAVTVIDFLGFKARKSIPNTQTTIAAHHTTKPLIWLGTILILISWIFLYEPNTLANMKSALLVVMIINGLFLSLYISPRLNALAPRKTLIPKKLQNKITLSFIISFLSWWTFVILTAMQLQFR